MSENGKAVWGAMAGAALGGVLMYLADPDRGRRRRARLREQVTHSAQQLKCVADKGLRDLQGRAQGVVLDLWSAVKHEAVDDAVLAERVRACLGRAVSHPGAIHVKATGGQIELSGPVLAQELDHLLGAVYSVRGVHGVDSRLEPHKSGENVPGLQGGVGRRRHQRSWAPGRRLLGMAGGGLALVAAPGRRAVALPLRVAGALLLTRAVANIPLRRFFGLARGRRTFRFQKTITIQEPLERVFAFWSHPENFSRVMQHIEEVQRTGDKRFRWTVRGPAGATASWESEITTFEPRRIIAWKSVPGALIGNAGIIRFENTSQGGTRLHILMSYSPPAGAVGHAMAKLFGIGPKEVLDDDLVRMKSLFEHGKTTVHGHTVKREELSA